MYVGDAMLSSDDGSSDDNSNGNAGISWSIQLELGLNAPEMLDQRRHGAALMSIFRLGEARG